MLQCGTSSTNVLREQEPHGHSITQSAEAPKGRGILLDKRESKKGEKRQTPDSPHQNKVFQSRRSSPWLSLAQCALAT